MKIILSYTIMKLYCPVMSFEICFMLQIKNAFFMEMHD